MATYTSSYKKKASGSTYEEIIAEIKADKIKPVYYLSGEQEYYIDRIADCLVEKLLTLEERGFNLLTFYGADSDVDQIITAARSFPMGAQRLVVLIKEAQALKKSERLELYLRQIQPSTVLIVCHKHGTIDKRLKLAGLIKKEGVLYESERLYDHHIPPFVRGYFKEKRVAIEEGVAEMIADLIGADLSRIATEIDKLIVSLSDGEKKVTVDRVKSHIGLSRNFSVFDLQDALIEKDVTKANGIAKYFDENERDNPIQKVLPMLFKFFSNLMMAYYAPDKSPQGVAAWLGGMSEYQAKRSIIPAMKRYSGTKVMYILSEIRRTDARSKGVDSAAVKDGELMKELLYFILH